jgi:hypothetical protein
LKQPVRQLGRQASDARQLKRQVVLAATCQSQLHQ